MVIQFAHTNGRGIDMALSLTGKQVMVTMFGNEPVKGTIVGYYEKNGTFLFQYEGHQAGHMTYEVDLSQIELIEEPFFSDFADAFRTE